MLMNYTLGNGQGLGKPKKQKRPTTPEEAGKISKAKRAQRFNNPQDKARVSTTMKINTQTEEMRKKGLEFNDHGIPKGGQKHKPFRIGQKSRAKYSK
jgi:hypothetical protein